MPSLKKTTYARDFMTTKIHVIYAGRTVGDAARLMKKFNCGALPVALKEKMVGILTDRDIAVRVVAQGIDAETMLVQECMTRNLDFCYDDDSAKEIARKIALSGHRRIPIMNHEKQFVGMVTLSDLAKRVKDSDITHWTVLGLSKLAA